MLYFDCAATTIPMEESLLAYVNASRALWGNPSSKHAPGKLAKEALETARTQMGALLRLPADTLYFTSGATESNAIIINAKLAESRERRSIISEGEHASVYDNVMAYKSGGWMIKPIKDACDNSVFLKKLQSAMEEPVAFVAIMAVNNETGRRRPMAEISSILDDHAERFGRKPHFHVDCTQALGKIPLENILPHVDSASFSSHKVGGPKGVGLLYVKKRFDAFLQGGGQERGVRGGTENLPGIMAFVTATSLALASVSRDRDVERTLLEGIRSCGGIILPENRLENDDRYSPFIIMAAFPPLPGEVLARALSDAELYVGTGSACGSHKKDRLRALLSTGVDFETASCAIRLSYTPLAKQEEATAAIETLRATLKSVRF